MNSKVQVVYRNEFGEQIPMKSVIDRLLQRFDFTDTSLAFYDNVADVKEFENWLISNRIPANDGSKSIEKRYLDLYYKLKDYQHKAHNNSKEQHVKKVTDNEVVNSENDNVVEVHESDDSQETAISDVVDTFDDKDFSLMNTLVPVYLNRFVNGDLGIKYRLRSDDERSVKPLDTVVQLQRQFFKTQFKDYEYVHDLIDNISYSSVVDSYTIYTQGCLELLTKDEYVNWCIARAFKRSSTYLIERLDKVINVKSIITSSDFPNDVRWFLFLSKHLPVIMDKYDNKRIIESQNKLNDDIILVQALLASVLSVDDDDTWNDALIGDRTKRYRNLIQRARTDILAPYKTYQRTEQTKNRFERE